MTQKTKKIIMGLGNPGSKYEKNRHNVGFMFSDYYIGSEKFKYNEDINCDIYKDDSKIVLKSHWFMNLSGSPLKIVKSRHSISNKNIIIIHDDVNLEFGEVKVKTEGGPGGHNGLKSIIEKIGTDEFTRIRVGVGRNKSVELINHVLGDFSEEELHLLNEQVIPKVKELLDELLRS